MPRYFDSITIDELKAKISKANLDEFPFITEKVRKDLEKVDFDTENTTHPNDDSYRIGPAENLIGYHTLDNGFTFLGGAAGGDWEYPVFFLIYLSGKELRGYIPENGNSWNTATKQSYGNDEDADLKNFKERFGIEDDIPEFDLEQDIAEKLIIEDIKSRILANPKQRSLVERFEDLKWYGSDCDEAYELFSQTCHLAYKFYGFGEKDKCEVLYKWAKDQADFNKDWVSKNEPEAMVDVTKGNWGH